MRTVTGEVVKSIIDEKCNGIYILLKLKDGKEFVAHSTTEHPWLKLKPGMSAQEELQKVCDLLNGYKEKIDGTIEKIDGKYPKTLTIKVESDI